MQAKARPLSVDCRIIMLQPGVAAEESKRCGMFAEPILYQSVTAQVSSSRAREGGRVGKLTFTSKWEPHVLGSAEVEFFAPPL